MKSNRKSFIKKFRISDRYFVYDVNTNQSFETDKSIYKLIDFANEDFGTIEKKFGSEFGNDELSRLLGLIQQEKSNGLFLSTQPGRLFFFDRKQVESEIYSNLNAMHLVLTENCNMRCKYCVYSGKYTYQRQHSSMRMTKTTVQDSLEFFFSHSKEQSIYLGFYGGEPLLEFDLIQASLEHLEAMKRENRYGVAEKAIHIQFTTNGTLLNEKVIAYLIQNKIGMMISLDGSQETHDRYRVMVNQGGSFQSVFKNIQMIKVMSPEYYREYVKYNVVLAPPIELKKTLDFFTEHSDLFADTHMMVTGLAPHDNDFITSPEIVEAIRMKRASYFYELSVLTRVFSDLVKKIDTGKPLTREEKTQYRFCFGVFGKTFKRIHEATATLPFSESFFLERMCVPGNHTLYVGPDGKCYFCRNSIGMMSIGDIENGLDIDRIMQINDEYIQLCEKVECTRCWAIQFCRGSCQLTAMHGEGYSLENKRKSCDDFKYNHMKYLKLYMKLLYSEPRIKNIFAPDDIPF